MKLESMSENDIMAIAQGREKDSVMQRLRDIATYLEAQEKFLDELGAILTPILRLEQSQEAVLDEVGPEIDVRSDINKELVRYREKIKDNNEFLKKIISQVDI